MKSSVGIFTHYGHISQVGSELLLTVLEGYPLVPEGYLYKGSLMTLKIGQWLILFLGRVMSFFC